MICAVIDIGSNTIRLSTYEYDDKSVKKLFHKKSTAGLASYISDDRMSQAGIDRCCHVLMDFRDTLDLLPVKEIGIFATASLRNVQNSAEAIQEISDRTGYTVQLLSGTEEAEYGYCGVRCMYQLERGLVIDIGGGSTELTVFADGIVDYADSFPIGSLNMWKKYVSGILPSENEIQRIQTQMKKTVGKDVCKRLRKCGNVVAVGGSARAILKIVNTLYQLPADNMALQLEHLEQLLQTFSKKESNATELILQSCPDRIHTLIPGLVILISILKETKEDTLHVCPYGVREGYLIRKILGKNDTLLPAL